MPTTRHLINRQRRLATVQASRTATPASRTAPATGKTRTGSGARTVPAPASASTSPSASASGSRHADDRGRLRSHRLPVALGVLTVLLGGFATWATGQAAALRDTPAARNAALTDAARTSEVKGQVTKAVNELFSYDYTATAAADRAVRAHLTGKAVGQHRTMLAPVRQQAARQKLVLTTTVTQSGVELIDGDRARVLIYADQSNTRTAAKKDATTYGAAMFAVEAVRKDGAWRIAAIDTLGAGS
ncbi:hypothetical protein E2C00_22060 [Streptomyces sp. WAC05374]|uniref:nuclear transport factor 2 family protein n=1 Tax=Streptomyces sp. WAC05374 TaxID=2487420 RepID=UPI000F86C7E7|nr:nuclear transport factor 2 family protein [Streptomyces sp. WAC05374]RST03087.1 hypothetical protein EF905_34365 [Streptomyces sp. WAC05374]TDF45954.1 hypothetical protein E2B92_11065 [Streptomyces sp. WAC05374]TDF52948.1 hypothetical protein E2C00_22060 [Streptomyces sp. WAC05374]TDF58162.1 hypothetical protein E2C02_06455 [Streptomyces sp. WAC05374]